jgi:hypothetical protein
MKTRCIRDPTSFAGVRTVLVLDEDARPAMLQSCHPRGDSRFSLQTRRGGLVKIYDSVLMPGVSGLYVCSAENNISASPYYPFLFYSSSSIIFSFVFTFSQEYVPKTLPQNAQECVWDNVLFKM